MSLNFKHLKDRPTTWGTAVEDGVSWKIQVTLDGKFFARSADSEVVKVAALVNSFEEAKRWCEWQKAALLNPPKQMTIDEFLQANCKKISPTANQYIFVVPGRQTPDKTYLVQKVDSFEGDDSSPRYFVIFEDGRWSKPLLTKYQVESFLRSIIDAKSI